MDPSVVRPTKRRALRESCAVTQVQILSVFHAGDRRERGDRLEPKPFSGSEPSGVAAAFDCAGKLLQRLDYSERPGRTRGL